MIRSNSPIIESNFQSELISPIDYQTNNSLSNTKESGIKFDNEISYCIACKGPILDRVVLKVGLSTWHVRCLHCTDCGIPLIDKCYSKNDEIFCKDDFFRRYGTRCAACDEVIPASEVIRKAQNNIYHLECFACISCHRQLNTGEEFFLLSSRKLMCRPDFEIAKTKEQELDQGNKRPRTTITAKQLEALKKTYSESSKPARHVREQLSAKTGLDMRVVQVWFQNRRAKEKRMKKDAGRGCWSSPYFQGENGGSKVTSNKGDSDELSDDQTNEPCDISYQSDVESDSEIFSCYGSSNNNNNNNNNNNISVPSTKEDSGNEKSSTALSPNSAEPEMTPVTLNNQIPQPTFEMCHRHLDLPRDGRVFPPIGLRDWMNGEHNTLFSANSLIGNNTTPNMIPNFMNSLNMVPGAFSNIGLLHQVNFEANCRNPTGFIHQIDPNKSA